MSSEIKTAINQQMKLAMKARDKARLGVIRLIQSEFKRIEVDERIELDDNRVLAILDKMVKQRRDSAKQYEEAGRTELSDQEDYEISVISEFLPDPLTEEEIAAMIDDAIESVGASGMQDMGQVMGMLKSRVQGRADVGKVSQRVKAKLS